MTSENETDAEKTAGLNRNSTNEKAATDLITNKTTNLRQNFKDVKTATSFEAGNSTDSISGPGPDGKSASYLTKKNSAANQINSISSTNIVLIMLVLAVLAYGIYRFKNE